MNVAVTRRALLGLLAPLAAVPVPPPANAAPRAPIALLRCPVMGLQYYDFCHIGHSLASGTGLVLRRQPSNPHDRRAIEVLTGDGAKLGHVPRVSNEPIAGLMDAGIPLCAATCPADYGHWCPLWMAITMDGRG